LKRLAKISTTVICILAAGLIATPIKADESLAPEAQIEHVTKLIVEYFPENVATMKRIARCESGMIHRDVDGTLLPNAEGGTARGAFQVLMRIHRVKIKRMGLDYNNDRDYMQYVRHLYDIDGTTPWAQCLG